MRYSAVYANGMANHLPMAQLALARLGATDDRQREFTEFYVRRLRLKSASEAALSEQLAEELARDGKEAWLRERLSRLTPGLATAAFHGLIRTAYAVDSGDDTDLPDALTSWIIDYAELGTREGERPFANAHEAFTALHGDDRFGGELPGRSITGRIAKVVAMPAFDDYRSSIRGLTLEELARIAVSIYLTTGDFTALHLVTACHATRVLAPYLAEDALDHLATAMLAAYATIGRPAFDVPLGNAPDWETLAAIAIASNDDHDLKLVYSCREEEAVYGWGLHRMAAALRLQG